LPELEVQKKAARAERFGVETKESQEAKRLERMRRFGLDIKNSDDVVEDKVEMDALKAKRLARFGEVDPTDLKRGNQGGKGDKKRT
jgi:hypothetical protein